MRTIEHNGARLIAMTEGEHAALVERCDRIIQHHVVSRGAMLTELAGLKVALDETMETAAKVTKRISLDDFRNVVGILKSLDLPDLQAAGLLCEARPAAVGETVAMARARVEWRAWERFRADPLSWMLVADDVLQCKIWTLVERRLYPTITVSEAHRTDDNAAP